MNHPASPAPSTLQPAAAGVGALTHIREFLAFKIANEEYGVDILRVQEIRSYEKPTTIANAPEHLKGVGPGHWAEPGSGGLPAQSGDENDPTKARQRTLAAAPPPLDI